MLTALLLNIAGGITPGFFESSFLQKALASTIIVEPRCYVQYGNFITTFNTNTTFTCQGGGGLSTRDGRTDIVNTTLTITDLGIIRGVTFSPQAMGTIIRSNDKSYELMLQVTDVSQTSYNYFVTINSGPTAGTIVFTEESHSKEFPGVDKTQTISITVTGGPVGPSIPRTPPTGGEEVGILFDFPDESKKGKPNFASIDPARGQPRPYAFDFPRLKLIPKFIFQISRLKLGRSVSSEHSPRYTRVRQGIAAPEISRGDSGDDGLVSGPPKIPGLVHRWLIQSHTEYSFEFEITFGEGISHANFFFLFDENGNGKYDGPKEMICQKDLPANPNTTVLIQCPPYRTPDLSFAKDTVLYGRAVVVNIDSSSPNLNVSDLSNAGDGFEGEAESYPFVQQLPSVDFEYPSEPARYNPQKLRLLRQNPQEMFYLGPEDPDEALVKEKIIDEKRITYEKRPKIPKSGEAKPGDDRSGLHRRGKTLEAQMSGEIFLGEGQNTLPVTITTRKSDPQKQYFLNIFIDQGADGKYDPADWVVRNQLIQFTSSGSKTVEVTFLLEKVQSLDTLSYMRIVFTDQPVQPAEGAGTNLFGEAETYLVRFVN